MTMRGKDRAALRAEANRLAATVHVGHAGPATGVVASLADALRARELVKVQVARQLERKPKELARELADATGAEIVQVIGRTFTVYRYNPDLHPGEG